MNGYDLGEVLRGQLRNGGEFSAGDPAGDGENPQSRLRRASSLCEGSQAECRRDIEAVTCEILHLKQELARNIVDIGLRLIEAKGMLSHGEWLPWLRENVCFSETTAQNYMKVAKEFPNPQLVGDLGVRKALTLLALPSAEREDFIEENNVIDMTSRELEKAIRERDEARKAAESAQAELKELRSRPVDVAVEVDREAVEKARAEAVAGMRARVDAAEKARKEAEEKRKEAEKALVGAQKEAGANAAILSRAEKAEAELAEARRQLEAIERAEKTAAVNADPDLAMFNVLFDQAQEVAGKMNGLRLKIGKDDADRDGKLKTAMIALSDMIRRYAE